MPGNRITFVLPDMRIGGAERVALRLIRSFLEAGERVHLVLMQERGELLADIPAEVEIFDLGAPRIRHSIRPLADYLRRYRPDAMQARMWPLTVAAIIAKDIVGSKTRLVVSDHTVLSRQYPAGSSAGLFLRISTRLFYRRADARLTVADLVADDLAKLSGVRRECFEVVNNPVDAPPADLRPTAEVEALWGNAAARLITVGTLGPAKNHRLLIRSFARLLKRRPEAKLMLVGNGPLEAELKALSHALKLSDRVIFAGFVPDPWPYYASADLFVLSSDREGYPNVLVEAMQSGVTVMSTDSGSGPRQILDDGRCGRLVPVGDEAALTDAMDDALRAPTPKGVLLERAAELSGDAAARRYLELLLGPSHV